MSFQDPARHVVKAPSCQKMLLTTTYIYLSQAIIISLDSLFAGVEYLAASLQQVQQFHHLFIYLDITVWTRSETFSGIPICELTELSCKISNLSCYNWEDSNSILNVLKLCLNGIWLRSCTFSMIKFVLNLRSGIRLWYCALKWRPIALARRAKEFTKFK